MPGNELVQSLGRGLDLLRLLAESDGGLRLPALTAASGLKRPTVFNLLRTLVDRGFAVQEAGRYAVGPSLPVLAAAAASNAFLRQAAEACRELAERLPQAIINFCEPVGAEILCRVQIVPRGQPAQAGGMTLYSPYCTASGLAALAFADPELRQQMQMRHPFAVEAIQVWPSEAKLERFLKEARARGFVLPPFCDKASFRLAARPKLASTGRLLGIFGAAWHAVPGAADGGTKTVLDALRAAAAHLPDERCGRGKGADKR